MTTAREDFETAWMTRNGMTKPPTRFPNGGDYVYPAANIAWWAWQAACAQSQQAAPDAARYRWLARKVGAHGVIDGWAFSFPTHLTIPAPPIAMYDPERALGESIDALIAAQGASNV